MLASLQTTYALLSFCLLNTLVLIQSLPILSMHRVVRIYSIFRRPNVGIHHRRPSTFAAPSSTAKAKMDVSGSSEAHVRRSYTSLRAGCSDNAQVPSNQHLDTHAMPPNFIQREHWRYQTMRKAEIESNPEVFDLSKYDQFSPEQKCKWRPARSIPAAQVEAACRAYNDDQPLRAKVCTVVLFFIYSSKRD